MLFLGLPSGGINLPDVHLGPRPLTPGGAPRPPSSLAPTKDTSSHAAATASAMSAAAGLPVPQVPPGSGSSSYMFTMANNSSNKHFRYKWPEHPQLRFYPSVGHLHAGQTREVTVTFVASAPVKLDQDIKVALSQITYKVGARLWAGFTLSPADFAPRRPGLVVESVTSVCPERAQPSSVTDSRRLGVHYPFRPQQQCTPCAVLCVRRETPWSGMRQLLHTWLHPGCAAPVPRGWQQACQAQRQSPAPSLWWTL